jgi:hypothetical protein
MCQKNPDCDNPTTIAGYCRRCYMRARRHGGDATIVKAAGRPRSMNSGALVASATPATAMLSPKTRRLFAQALDALLDAGVPGDIMLAAMQVTQTKAGRPNASMFHREATAIAAMVSGGGPDERDAMLAKISDIYGLKKETSK